MLATVVLIARDTAIHAAVVASNGVAESADEIKRRDAAWIANRRDPLRQVIVKAPCSDRVRELVKDDPLVVEAFVMNDRGTLVCSIAETSDYMQGDEPKWQKTFLEGKEAFVEEPAFDASKLQDCREFRRQVAAENAQATGRLIGLGDGIDYLAIGGLGAEALNLLGQRFAGAGHHVAIEQSGLQQFTDDHLHTANPVDVDHRILAIRAGVSEDRNDVLRQMVELSWRHDLFPEVREPGGARDLRRM